jgi:hypothetical protein
MATKVTVGANALSFHDQSTGITIAKGEVKELNSNQARNRRIMRALNSGHLQYVTETKEVKKYSKSDIEKLLTRLNKQYEKGIEPAKAAKTYTLEEATLMAKSLDIEIEEGDTVADIIEVICQEFGKGNEEE